MLDPTKAIMDWEQADQIIQDQRAEIERLREAIRRLADQDATLSLLCKRDGSCVVTVTMDATLTDEEREAIHWFSEYGDLQAEARRAEVLKGLLERLGGPNG